MTNSVFFALQTTTTTGFGSQVFLEFEGVQYIANFGMAAGATFFPILLAAAFTLMTRRD